MRLWSLHPSYLDRAGLVAAWREALLAQKVLEGGTVGYTRHPQLLRFKASDDPLAAVGKFLDDLEREAEGRGYRFDRLRIRHFDPGYRKSIPVGEGQLLYELELLRWKLEKRDPERARALPAGGSIRPNSAFSARRGGGIEAWEKTIAEVLDRC